MRASRVFVFATIVLGLSLAACGDDGAAPGVTVEAGADQSVAEAAPEAGDGGAETGAVEAGRDATGDADAPIEAGEAEAAPGPICGNGVVEPGETCDDGFRDPCGACNATCDGAGDQRPHWACGCAPVVASADAGDGGDSDAEAGASGGDDFSAGMVGCPGTVQWEARASLCGGGYTPCTFDDWIARRAGLVPQHHYWTNEDLKFVYESRDGVHDSCYLSKTYGMTCDTKTRVCAEADVDPEKNHCDGYPHDCGRLDPPHPANDYFGGYYGDFTAGTLCCCGDAGPGCATTPDAAAGDVFPGQMFGCAGSVSWDDRASLCAAGCTVCTAQDWMTRRNGAVPTQNYWTDDNLKASGSGDGECNVSKIYGTDGAPWPMRVCGRHTDDLLNTCVWIDCGYADIAPPPNEYIGGCGGSLTSGTLCCDAQVPAP